MAARRDLKIKPLSGSSHLRCCEDHFNLAEDAENFMRWKMMGGPLRMKKDVVPHIFECQSKPTGVLLERPALKKRKILEILANSSPACTSKNIPSGRANDIPNESFDREELHLENQQPTVKVEKGIQVHVPFRSKKTQTCGQQKITIGTSPMKETVESISTSPGKTKGECGGSTLANTTSSSSDEYEYQPDSSSSEFIDSEEELSKIRQESFQRMSFFIERDPKIYLGIHPSSYIIISLLCEKVKTSQKKIMICLKKIKLNDNVKILANEFGMHYSSISRVLKETIPLISKYMSDLVYWPGNESRLRTLPTAFIAHFAEVTCIIDCLEIAIEKPSNSLYQAHTWSEYKKANTIKYFISCLPNGFINFISEGYLGRTTDEAIFLDCGFIEKIPPGSTVMADRGFKHIESVLVKHSCKLIRPPSISAGQMMSQHDARLTKKVASLRIHVERVIGRIRDYGILKPYTVMDHSLISMSDHMMVIACGLINLDKPLIKA